MRMDGLSRRGDYLVMVVLWDADATRDMAPANLMHSLKSYAKQRSSEKEFLDLGNIGRPNVDSVDFDVGLAEVSFRSTESRVGPREVIIRERSEYHDPVTR
jgi:hypothetical protein